MTQYFILIIMPDGSKGEHKGPYPDAFAAIVRAIDLFPEACRISARRLA